MSLAEAGSAALVFLGGGGVWALGAEWWKRWAGRKDAASAAAIAAPAQITQSQAELAQALTEQIRTTLDENAKDRRQLRRERATDKREMKAMRGEVASLRAAVDQCEGRHDECREELATVKAQVDRYMAENPPAGAYETLSRPL